MGVGVAAAKEKRRRDGWCIVATAGVWSVWLPVPLQV